MKGGMSRVSLFVMLAALLVVCFFSCAKEKSFENKDATSLRSREYPLNEVGGSGVLGSIVISENSDSSFNVLVSVTKSVQDTVHVVHIHKGAVGSGGTVAVNLTPITGTGGATESETTNISEIVLPDNTTEKINYDGIMNFTGYVDVHYSALKSDSLLAEGAIGP